MFLFFQIVLIGSLAYKKHLKFGEAGLFNLCACTATVSLS